MRRLTKLPVRNSMWITTHTFFTKCRKLNTMLNGVVNKVPDIFLLQKKHRRSIQSTDISFFKERAFMVTLNYLHCSWTNLIMARLHGTMNSFPYKSVQKNINQPLLIMHEGFRLDITVTTIKWSFGVDWNKHQAKWHMLSRAMRYNIY